ncbi:TetR/AcrR family transcriptional regulator [Companilactobacillus zhachilii]|uniref:TetR/AcrR family transcriptional regulator n=1 Tax=Companilactobacillus zhachilii TaxID=2304606 RepID=UPI001920674D|nr:TetR/AcrR family transcriptional regulator [Companilactobacillus zhachilii]MBL3530281.1 TetR/AcrR family transcriptional regulator [Companilactobacillus zhachilii]
MDRDTSVENVTRMQKQTKQWIKDSLIELLKDYDLEEITVKQIVVTADISRPTFYRYYATKEEVLEELINDMIQGYAVTAMETTATTFDEILKVFLDYFQKKQSIIKILIRAHLTDYFISTFTKSFVEKMDEFPASWRNWKNDLQISLGVQFATGGLLNVLIGWVATGCKIDSEIIVRNVMMILHDLGGEI